MIRILSALCLSWAMASGSVVWADAAQDFQNATIAYEKQDYTTALKLFKSLAEQGHVKAQHNLGFMYANGEGVAQDYSKAVEWLTKAAGQGHKKAQEALKWLNKQ
ncbi:tetratricopeptide repeat protein [Thiofilum flexile]|uniref:tetratricopeptide repeat protein n=1 Tax=Thiofilum flexile TaxID=125627 RepID=UPI000369D5ED|nr:tetratricopeptide repeat protein [Thiofilum flexile]